MGKVKTIEVDRLLSSRSLRPNARSAGVPLLDLTSSELLLKLCERLGVGVLGIEGFTLVDSGRRPEIDYIADFSNLLSGSDFTTQSIEGARRFLRLATMEQKILFEYVLAVIGTSEDVGK